MTPSHLERSHALLRSLAVALLGFVLAVGILAITPTSYEREPAKSRGGASVGPRAHATGAGMGSLGNRMGGGRVENDYVEARRSFDQKPKGRKSISVTIPLWPLKAVLLVVALACLSRFATLLYQWLALRLPRTASS